MRQAEIGGIANVTEPESREFSAIEIPEDLMPLLSVPASWSDCCIYRVPEVIRNTNEAVYTPQVVSIGPLHHRTKKLMPMNEQKLRYLAQFCARAEKQWPELERKIKTHEEKIRNSYEETTELSSKEFVKMIPLDSVFVIEFFLRRFEGYEGKDFILDKPWLESRVTRDLILLENQLPFFVLQDLYNFAFPKPEQKQYPSFHMLACMNFKKFVSPPVIENNRNQAFSSDCFSFLYCFLVEKMFWWKKLEKPKDAQQGLQGDQLDELIGFFKKFQGGDHKHFLDLVRKFRSCNPPQQKDNTDYTRLLYSASKLREAGVKFKVSPGSWPLKVRFENGKLEMPMFVLEDNTECLIRNLMAFEQCHYPHNAYICNYIVLLDSLINTEKDIDLLVHSGVIVHGLGNDEEVAKLVNKLGLQITISQCCYSDIAKELNRRGQDRWYRTVAIMRHVYFSDLLRGTATVAASVLLLLTFIQSLPAFEQIF